MLATILAPEHRVTQEPPDLRVILEQALLVPLALVEVAQAPRVHKETQVHRAIPVWVILELPVHKAIQG